jgi:prepilin signal peptidase PulO-like enzyme (type II secretory pathway)
MRSIKTLLLTIALIAALFATLFIFSLNVIDPKILLAIAVISAIYGAISISSIILVHRIRRDKKYQKLRYCQRLW